MRFRDHEPAAVSTDLLLAECDRFLDGSIAEVLSEADGSVPAWAWMNCLAHASRQRLHALAERPADVADRPELWAWHRTVAFLAEEVLLTAERSATPVEALQRRVLVPLELRLGAQRLGPSSLLRLVLGALAEPSVPET
ncbi:MAG TPA: hypothetical protein VKV23_06905 [Acidimicrobiales bacterium]|nr:hypothetical protein [Acidimicrobiales bacterium]